MCIRDRRNAANRLAVRLRGQLGKRVCGPAVPEISKIGGYHRLILLLKLENGISCSGVKNRLREEIRILKQEKQLSLIHIWMMNFIKNDILVVTAIQGVQKLQRLEQFLKLLYPLKLLDVYKRQL